MPARKSVLVTVGTTKFEALIRAVDSRAFENALVAKGYSHLVIQKGAGEYAPRVLLPDGASAATLDSGLKVECFDFAPSLAAHVADAALVISHAGSGSIFESLTAGKALIVVPNPLLMDNHQAELGSHLRAMGVLECAAPDELTAAVLQLDTAKLKPYTRGDASGIVAAIDTLTGRVASGSGKAERAR
ncbi:UDP-N-acetylglucosamine transferase subunit [Raphidocelis subcapitata]|uniref:UDP-N-acetylglucosamine transferase subunit n=1 Tax=Raphidocelis subcapitata TaxID=307507 RepID=A0A2V0P8J8_9CHLO|nr:UDP-N-acetylglucosamine transferase subunit [Raphidocelis subcapitata]|eukprot:GBF94213.1 UDP-N-acetylglucosamine transferase subunit [Raphidocelis subcapitata]